MEQAIELMTGIVMFVLGASFMAQSDAWKAWFEDIRLDTSSRALPIGAFALALSAFIVAFHPVWSGFFMLVTIIGVLGIVEGSLYLLFPASLGGILSMIKPYYQNMLRFWGALFALLGMAIIHVWFGEYGII